jgi:type IV secretory pathway VirB10-like protein
MALITRPRATTKRSARRFRWVLGSVTALVGAAIVAQLWWSQLWRSDKEPERPDVREPIVRHFEDYDLPEPPEPEIVEVQVPVTQPAPEAPQEREQRPRVQARRAEQRPRPPQLSRHPGFSWRVSVAVEPVGYRDGRVEMLGEGCALRPGASVIPAVLLTAVNSEIPGQVIASVMSDVYSPDAGYENKILIPTGTRVVGVVDKGPGGELTFDRRRIDIAWTDMTLPGGRQIFLGRAFDASVDGSAGTGGVVEHRYGQLVVFATLSTVFSVLQRGTFAGDNAFIADAQRETSGTLGDIGETVLERSLDWEPVIKIPADAQVRILVNETLQVC